MMHNAAAQKSAARLIVFYFNIWIFSPKPFGLLWKVSGCHNLLVTMTPFPRVTTNAESIF